MNSDDRFSKVQILLQQEKYSEAERYLTDLLRENPNDVEILSLMAEIKLHLNNLRDAHQIIDNAIGLSPDTSYLYYNKARIAFSEEKKDEAQKYAQQAIDIDPYDADYFSLLAHIKLSKKKYEEALDHANQALELDAENLMALNVRSTALTKLNRKDDAYTTIQGALKEDPNNAYTHANYGWGLLENGDHKKALKHFKESLSHDPNFEFAQGGMLEALKASNPIYRLFLKYAFWMSKMTAQYQWGVIIGFYLGFRGLKALARSNPALEPYLTPLIVVLAVVAFSTWIITPVSNLFLRFNKYGQMLLDKKEKMSSNFVAMAFIAFVIGLLLYLTLSDQRMLAIAAFGFAMMLPFGSMFAKTKYKYALLIYAIVLALVGIAAIGITFSTGLIYHQASTLFMFGFIAYQWVANFILIREDNA